MQRQGTHLFSLPSALRRRGSNSTLNSSSGSAVSQSPDAPTIALPSSSRSSLAESSCQEHYGNTYQDWSLLSIARVQKSHGMVLVTLYHLPSTTMYTWPLQTDPKAPQPKQGTVFIASNNGSSDSDERTTSESLKVLTGVLLTWMRQREGLAKVKLGEREKDTEWLRMTLQMPRIDDDQKQAIMERQVVRPLQEWSGAGPSESSSPMKGKGRVLNSLNTNTKRGDASLKSSLAVPKVPSIEVSSPNSSDVLSQQKAPWLRERKSSYVS